ncbi:MAG: hypothetical protein ACFFD2_21035 [Promethearchaeota archaeon]
MIHNFYIIKKNGICVFHKKFGSLEEDPQSMAGFLTAISMFSEATVGENIKILETNNFKFTFNSDTKFTFITFTDNSDRHKNIQKLLDNIKNCFYKKFPKLKFLYKSGNLKPFKKFNGDLENIISKYQ